MYAVQPELLQVGREEAAGGSRRRVQHKQSLQVRDPHQAACHARARVRAQVNNKNSAIVYGWQCVPIRHG